MQLGDLGTHLDTKLCIQVGQRFVHEQDLRVTDNGTSHGNTLSLAAGKSLRLAVKQFIKVKDLGCFINLFLDLILRNLAKLQSESHVVKYGHMRIQSVVLEDHGDIAVFRLDIVHDLVVNLQGSGRDVLKSCDHTKGCGFSAA